jgi:hypothetical protein
MASRLCVAILAMVLLLLIVLRRSMQLLAMSLETAKILSPPSSRLYMGYGQAAVPFKLILLLFDVNWDFS